jgi:hypothetical protein
MTTVLEGGLSGKEHQARTMMLIMMVLDRKMNMMKQTRSYLRTVVNKDLLLHQRHLYPPQTGQRLQI